VNRPAKLLFLIVAVSLALSAGCAKKQPAKQEAHRETTGNAVTESAEPVIDQNYLLETMFHGLQFAWDGEVFRDGEGHGYYIERIEEGDFINRSGEELLVIVRRPADELSHADGFYQAYAAVFDGSAQKCVSAVKKFSADEGRLGLFTGQEKSYLFFAGSTTYHGWTDWTGGLWQAGAEWSQKWPVDKDFWEDKAVEIEATGLKVMQRKTVATPDKAVPDYDWEYLYRLRWNAATDFFEEVK
jgi:hypothetical protein